MKRLMLLLVLLSLCLAGLGPGCDEGDDVVPPKYDSPNLEASVDAGGAG